MEPEMMLERVYREIGPAEKSRVQGLIARRVDLGVVQRCFLGERLSSQEHSDCCRTFQKSGVTSFAGESATTTLYAVLEFHPDLVD